MLSSRDLSRLLSIDHWHHEALIAFSPPPRTPIGVARYVRLSDFDAAEVAIEVVDDWQRQGVGSALMVALAQRARAAGIRRFTMSILRGNRGALALAGKLGPPISAPVLTAAGNVVELSQSLVAVPVGPPPVLAAPAAPAPFW